MTSQVPAPSPPPDVDATASALAEALLHVGRGDELSRVLAERLFAWVGRQHWTHTEGGGPYARHVVSLGDAGEVMVATWRGGARAPCAAHDHGDAAGVVLVARGTFRERTFVLDATGLTQTRERVLEEGAVLSLAPGVIHDMASIGERPGVTLHLYAPSPAATRLYDDVKRRTLLVGPGSGAWLPAEHVLDETPWPAPKAKARTVWIGYTTLYRDGGPKFARAARTLGRELSKNAHARVVVQAVESKAEFVAAMSGFRERGEELSELHFIGHSGLYGPMFRTTSMPEQFSPHEWANLAIPFSNDAAAYFHCCRSARWFAPFFARTFGVRAHGYHLYTTFSRRKDRFRWDVDLLPKGKRTSNEDAAPLYVVALPGKKSHGVLASLAKYSHLAPTEKMTRFDAAPDAPAEDRSYDAVADLYDAAFQDIGVRRAEVRWIERHLPARASQGASLPRVLELGAGNGSLLARLAPRIESGLGVDASAGMVERARRRFGHLKNVAFEPIAGPSLPCDDHSIDVVVSMLSWRYLDWDPIMAEIRRVLVPGGRLLVVDMVALPVRARDAPRFLKTKLDQARVHATDARFRRDLRRLVTHRDWATMLKHNPMRAEHEYRWYFESRFPGRKLEVLTVAFASRVVAFDSGPLARDFALPQSYP